MFVESAGRPDVIAGGDPTSASGLTQILAQTGSLAARHAHRPAPAAASSPAGSSWPRRGARPVSRRAPESVLPAGIDPSLAARLAEMDEISARSMVLDLLKSMDIELDSARSPDEIVSRLVNQAWSQAPRLEQALTFLSELCRLNGAPARVLHDAEGLLAAYGIGLEPLYELRAIFETLASYSVDQNRLTLDLGLSRGLQYYTGMIFRNLSRQPRRRKPAARRRALRRPGADPGRAQKRAGLRLFVRVGAYPTGAGRFRSRPAKTPGSAGAGDRGG